MSDNTGNPFDGFEMIYAYTRQMALVDGVLVEMRLARRFGFKPQMVCTQRVWETLIRWPDPDADPAVVEFLQTWREAHILKAAMRAIQAKLALEQAGVPDHQPERVDFFVRGMQHAGGQPVATETALYMLNGPEGLTVMYPEED